MTRHHQCQRLYGCNNQNISNTRDSAAVLITFESLFKLLGVGQRLRRYVWENCHFRKGRVHWYELVHQKGILLWHNASKSRTLLPRLCDSKSRIAMTLCFKEQYCHMGLCFKDQHCLGFFIQRALLSLHNASKSSIAMTLCFTEHCTAVAW